MKFEEAIKLVENGIKMTREKWFKDEFSKDSYLHIFFNGINVYLSCLNKSIPYNISFEDVYAEDWEPILYLNGLENYKILFNRQLPNAIAKII